MTDSNPDSLQTLLDKQALHELVMSYCRGIDRRDYQLAKSVYHEDAREERGAIFTGTGYGFVDFAAGDCVNYEITVHRIFNTLFRVNGDKAEGEIYCEAYHRTKGTNPMEITAGGRYIDRYEKRNGQWGIIYRTATMDRCEMKPVDQEAYRQFVAGSIAGKPGKDDLSYQVLKWL